MRRTLLGFIRKELRQTLRDPRMRILLFVAPLIQLTVFGFAVSNEVKNIRLAMVAAPDDTLMQDLYRRCIASGWFLPAQSRELEPFKMIQADQADAVLVAPMGGLSKAIGRGNAKLQLLVDATNVLQAQGTEAYLLRILQTTVQERLHMVPPEMPIAVEAR